MATASVSDPPDRADVVVIGADVVGASVAYHLVLIDGQPHPLKISRANT
ncbi:MAG: FAD-binding oxidoreductase [Alphaproteobacteria bacterium]|nr:FAD-binding oxidoreductase [Alphaproteobacteria bacterium]